MKTLETLIKLNKRYLDEKRRELVEAEEVLIKLTNGLTILRHERQKESASAKNVMEAAYTYEHYLSNSLGQEQKIIDLIKSQSNKIEKIRTQVLEMFGELKRFEIVRDIKEEEKEKEEEKRERMELDEISITAFIRKEDERKNYDNG